MKVLINTIGKKIHTLVKKNTPSCHNLGRNINVVSFKMPLFSLYYIYCVFIPTVRQILVYVGRLDLYLLTCTQTKKYMTAIYTCLNF